MILEYLKPPALIAVLATILLLTADAEVHAAPRSATEADRAAIEAAGLTYVRGMLWDPDNKYVGTSVAEAKQYLKTLKCSGRCNFELLNDSFAKCSARFFKEFQDRHGPVEIVSAYRSAGHERALCKNNPRCGAQMNNPNPTSNHSKGLAIDVYYRPDQSKLWSFAKQDKRFGVCFPFEDGSGGGFADRPHMILQGIPGSGEAASCVRRGYGNTPCSGSNFDPNSIRDVASGPPSAELTNTLRDVINPVQNPAYQQPYQQQPYQQQQEQMCALPDGSQVPCSAIANRNAQPPGGPAPVGAPIPQQQQVLPQSQQPFQQPTLSQTPASNQLSPTTETSNLLKALAGSGTSSATKDTENEDEPSAFEQISDIASPSASGEASNVSELILAVSGSDAQVLASSETDYSATSSDEDALKEKQATATAETFTSRDLSESPRQAAFSGVQPSALQSFLATLRDSLVSMLAYLRPFGRPDQEY